MSWPKASKEKEALLAELVEGIPCEAKRMFGAPVYFAKHSMFAGVFADDVFLRLGEEDRVRFLKEWKGARTFQPVEGKGMREYVVVPHALLKNRAAMKEWLRRSFDHAAGLKKR